MWPRVSRLWPQFFLPSVAEFYIAAFNSYRKSKLKEENIFDRYFFNLAATLTAQFVAQTDAWDGIRGCVFEPCHIWNFLFEFQLQGAPHLGKNQTCGPLVPQFWAMFEQVGYFCVSRGPFTFQLTQISYMDAYFAYCGFFLKSQNPHNTGTVNWRSMSRL